MVSSSGGEEDFGECPEDANASENKMYYTISGVKCKIFDVQVKITQKYNPDHRSELPTPPSTQGTVENDDRRRGVMDGKTAI